MDARVDKTTTDNLRPHDAGDAVRLDGVQVTLASRAGPVEILKGIDVCIASGEAVSIIGPSGSGKTTLLMVIAGLEAATGGTVQVASQTLNGLSEDQLAVFRRDNIGIVFQSFHLIPAMTALENVAVPLELRGTEDAFGIARDHLKRVGLDHRMDHYPGSCPVANSNAWQSHVHWQPAQRSSWPTSQPAIWTRKQAIRSWTCCSICNRLVTLRWCW